MTGLGPLDNHSVLAGIPDGLRNPLLAEYRKLARNYAEGRWEPAELNAGKLCEIVYSILRGHVDQKFPPGPTKPPNMVDACNAFSNATGFPRSVRIQMPRMLIALYEIRNNRNVGHVGADVDPNHVDASVVLSMSKWLLAELIRIFHAISIEDASRIIEGLAERTLPIVWRTSDSIRVLGSHLDAKQKMLALLYGTGGKANVLDVIRSIGYSNPSQFRKTVVRGAHKADFIHFDQTADTVEISPLGVRFVEENISLSI